jgi:26S proteasome regulatory subunit N1
MLMNQGHAHIWTVRCAGFQTHDTPVLLATSDRAELATEKYLAVSPLLEGVVIVKKNPAYVEGTD